MKPNRLFPSDDPRLPYNVSRSHTLLNDDTLIEIIALDLPENVHVLIERSFQYDDCADERWLPYTIPCCDVKYLSNTAPSVFLTIPNKYRFVYLLFNGTSYETPAKLDLESTTLIVRTLQDATGSVRQLLHCCN